MNQYIFQLIHQFAGRNAFADGFGIFFAEYLPYLLVLGFLLLVFYYDKRGRARFLLFADGALAVILARGMVTEIIRFFYNHERPFEMLNFAPLIGESGNSFPSGHAAWFFALALIVFYYNRKLGWWYFALAALNGLARVFVGVHWPLDILGGAVIGLASGFFVHELVKPHWLALCARTVSPADIGAEQPEEKKF